MNSELGMQNSPEALDWLLDNLVNRLPEAESALVLSADGLALAKSRGLGREDAEQLAAMSSALHSLAGGVGLHFGKGMLQQTVIELEGGYLVVTEAGFGACLALLASVDADLGMVAYEMNVIVGQVRDHLSAAPRVSRAPLRQSYAP
ncbi:roadblock/LC7 domain-containing protein [Nocardia flavorosea]|uniref:Roadblock/LC7 domain-containing protein n=1 Tax=Nocardia flavorosea TaxID=53429 RepID=A0A846Y5W3_9NOCA|nr:roadblock/LC7 domain-containing protein [Nocardia flavorosea]NKY54593.1 roadblock/LC7 domain-containing protein [Nocardia flavorosea]